jgi:diaminopimelate epimerase
MNGLRFWKGQALGNDYLIVDGADLSAPLSAAHAIRLCDRHRGAGSDGVLVADLSTQPFTLQIINPDGTAAEKSGNGLRIFGAFLYGRGLVQLDDWFDVRLPRDVVALRVEAELDAGAVMIRARMGPAVFDGAAVGFMPRPTEVLAYELRLPDGTMAAINTVSLGNPHCVVFVDELERADFLARAPQLCTHPAFTAGTNVQFARVAGRRELDAWIWERGAGETLASGSSACAVAAAAVRRGSVPHGSHTVRMLGGNVEVTVDQNFEVELLGPAVMVYEGKLINVLTD